LSAISVFSTTLPAGVANLHRNVGMGSRGPVRGLSHFEKFKDHFYFIFRRVIDFASL